MSRTLGCMIFELLTGRWLFNPQEGQILRIDDGHLAKIAELTEENLSYKNLTRSRKYDEYFDESGKLLHIDQPFPVTLESAMVKYGLSEAEADAAFIHACLHLDPEE
ncbi:hypothetical protein BDR05DRAFT_1057460 [Suillus weaverae]|nr:hypothetical protein BDR05DRAFT_1057460 [Suillus weaverae]